MTESLRERCIRGMAVNDHPDLLKVAEHHLDRLLDVLEESAQEWVEEADIMDELNSPPTDFELLEPISNPYWFLAVLRGNSE